MEKTHLKIEELTQNYTGKIDNRAIALPSFVVEEYLKIEREHLESGQLSWGKYYTDKNWFSDGTECGMYALPVCSNGAGQMLLLRHWSSRLAVCDSTPVVHYPVNTMEAIPNLPTFFVSEPVEVVRHETGLLNEIPFDFNQISKGDLVVFTPIGGFENSVENLRTLLNHATEKQFYVMIDAAHAQYLGFEDYIAHTQVVGLVYSFFATKVTPIGEGGLIVTGKPEIWEYLASQMMYNRFNGYAGESINLRIKSAESDKMKFLFQNEDCLDYFVGNRLEIFDNYSKICDELGVSYIKRGLPGSGNNTNGYKFIITDVRIQDLGMLFTSPVFAVSPVHHICPATYPQMNIPETYEYFREVLKINLENL